MTYAEDYKVAVSLINWIIAPIPYVWFFRFLEYLGNTWWLGCTSRNKNNLYEFVGRFECLP